MKMPEIQIEPENIILLHVNGDNAKLCCHFDIPSKLASELLIELLALGMVEHFNVRGTRGAATQWEASMFEE